MMRSLILNKGVIDMVFFTQGLLKLRNTTAQAVRTGITAFQERYHHFLPKNSKTHWKCLVLKSGAEEIRLQLIDLKYDVKRGTNASYESPVFLISLAESGENVLLRYQLKWLPSVVFCFSVVLLFAAFLCGYGVCDILHIGWSADSVMRAGLGFLILFGFVYWIFDKRRHDKRIEHVFKELMAKNFEMVL